MRGPNTCNVCGKVIPKYKQKCKDHLGYEKICLYCNSIFFVTKKNQKFCSHPHFVLFYQSNRIKELEKKLGRLPEENTLLRKENIEIVKENKMLLNSIKIQDGLQQHYDLVDKQQKEEIKQFKIELDYLKSKLEIII